MTASRPSVMVLLGRALFARLSSGADVGSVLAFDRHPNAPKLAELLGGPGGRGRLFVVTVRPDGERLWLVGILEDVRLESDRWVAARANAIPITDISALRPRIRFASRTGILAAPGALGMALQTPRALSPEDESLLRDAAAGNASPPEEAAALDPERARLLAEVIADPDSDAPRLDYAEWLLGREDPRGIFITASCALASASCPRSERASLRAHAKALLRARDAEWAAPARDVARRWTFRRGFIDEIHADAAALLDRGAALFAVEPVVRVALEDLRPKLCARLGETPWLSGVRSLRARGRVGDDGAVALVGSGALANLRELNLGDCGLRARGAAALAGAKTALESLVLTGNAIGDQGLARLTETSLLAECTRLYVGRCELSDEAAARLADSPQVANLKRLCIAGNPIRNEGALALARSARLSALERLEIDLDDLSENTIRALYTRFGTNLAVPES